MLEEATMMLEALFGCPPMPAPPEPTVVLIDGRLLTPIDTDEGTTPAREEEADRDKVVLLELLYGAEF